jgi:sec-independent protein translocase protein TatA
MIAASLILGIGMPGAAELMIIMAIFLLLFGGAKLPMLMRNLGKSANEFKRGMNDSLDGEDSPAHKD